MENHKENIHQVRELVLIEVEKDVNSFDLCDINRVREDDEYIYRFLEDRYNKIDDAYKMLIDCLRWRKSFGVNQMKESDFPQEIFRVGELFEFHKDKNGISTLYLRIDRHRPLPCWKEIIKRYIIFMIEKAEKMATLNGAGIGLVIDARNGKIYHVEIDLDYFALKSIVNYYPGCLQYLGIYEVPWVLMAIIKLIRTWLPAHYQDKITFISKSNIDEMIGLENVPTFMGGQLPMLWPEECFTASQAIKLEENGIVSKGSTDKLYKTYGFALKDFYDSEIYIKSLSDAEEKENTQNDAIIANIPHSVSLAQVAV